MSVKTVKVDNSVRKRIKKLPLHINRKIIEGIEELRNNPLKGVKLRGELSEFHKLRIGDYRIIYSFRKKSSQLIIVKVEHRQGVYK